MRFYLQFERNPRFVGWTSEGCEGGKPRAAESFDLLAADARRREGEISLVGPREGTRARRGFLGRRTGEGRKPRAAEASDLLAADARRRRGRNKPFFLTLHEIATKIFSAGFGFAHCGGLFPQVFGTRIKTRKRNIAAPLDPAAFADAVVLIYLENAGDLELVVKNVEASDLNFSRYGDTFFEVVFTGGRTQPGTIKPDEGERHPYSVLDCQPKREAILPSVLYIQKILRRKPFLIKNLENVMQKFLQSLELFEENERQKLAIFTALAFSQKLSGLQPETVFQSLLKDNLVAKGIVLSFVTVFFKEYLVENSLDDLILLLKRGKMDDKLLDCFPIARRSAECFSEHFTKEGLLALVEYNEKKIFEVKLKEMKTALTTQIAEETDISEVIQTAKQHVKDANLPDIEVVRILWDMLMDAVQWSSKNQQQNANSVLRQVKTWSGLLNAFCTSGKLELELMYKVQIQCYEDAKLMKLFPDIIRSLYEQDVLAEDSILLWFRKGSNPKGRQTFVKALESFVNWLEEAEEEE
ncbi:hypothetical protein ZIOFF_004381 [Zingiber officinale]|uniref:W2 domain-containing protein n=1 Tax=Zingiber officinale TaxID=94328 RepID=A0A8J5I830_ZINOF|nr:hypothetical protein ZIOFF_004381 [Zingiber officinale]